MGVDKPGSIPDYVLLYFGQGTADEIFQNLLCKLAT